MLPFSLLRRLGRYYRDKLPLAPTLVMIGISPHQWGNHPSVTCHREAVMAQMVPRPQHAVLSPDGKSRGNVTVLGATLEGTAAMRWSQSLTLICLRLESFNMLSVSLCAATKVSTLRNNPSTFVCLHKMENLCLEGVSPSRRLYWLDDIWVEKKNFYQLSHEPKFHLTVYEQFPGEQPSFVSPNEWYRSWKGPIIIIAFKEFCFLQLTL